jgi:hypothetical protein
MRVADSKVSGGSGGAGGPQEERQEQDQRAQQEGARGDGLGTACGTTGMMHQRRKPSGQRLSSTGSILSGILLAQWPIPHEPMQCERQLTRDGRAGGRRGRETDTDTTIGGWPRMHRLWPDGWASRLRNHRRDASAPLALVSGYHRQEASSQANLLNKRANALEDCLTVTAAGGVGLALDLMMLGVSSRKATSRMKPMFMTVMVMPRTVSTGVVAGRWWC